MATPWREPILLISLVALIMALTYFTLRYRWYTYISRVRFYRAYRAFKQLYAHINTTAVSLQARRKLSHDQTSLIYGEIEFYPFYEILRVAKPQPTDVFYDLGSGAGKAVFAAALLFSCKKVVGIERLDKLYQLSRHLQVRLLNKAQGAVLKTRDIAFIEADFLSCDFSDVQIILINATAFFGEYWKTICDKLCTAKPGARVIVVTQLLARSEFICLHQKYYRMSWGYARVSIYKKVF